MLTADVNSIHGSYSSNIIAFVLYVMG